MKTMKGNMIDQVQRWVKWCLPFYLFTFLPVASAQQITGRAPSQVAVGEQFRLTYTVNTDDVKGFRAGSMPGELEVLMDAVELSDGQRPHLQQYIGYLYLYPGGQQAGLFHHSASTGTGGRQGHEEQ